MKPLIVLDCDGVLLDYNLAYASQWKRVFGTYPREKDPKGFFPWERWDIHMFDDEQKKKWNDHSDFHFWSTMPAIPGALESCRRLVEYGYDLVCVTALDPEHLEARKKNLVDLGFPLNDVIATGRMAEGNPKAAIINKLAPDFFVDDHLPYFESIHPDISCIWIDRSDKKEHGLQDCYLCFDLMDFVSCFSDILRFYSRYYDSYTKRKEDAK